METVCPIELKIYTVFDELKAAVFFDESLVSQHQLFVFVKEESTWRVVEPRAFFFVRYTDLQFENILKQSHVLIFNAFYNERREKLELYMPYLENAFEFRLNFIIFIFSPVIFFLDII